MSKNKSPKSQQSSKKGKTSTPSIAEMDAIIQSYYHETAEALLNKATALANKHPHHSFPWEFISIAQEMLGHLEQALSAGKRAVQLDPMNAEAQSNLGNLFRTSGNLAEAESCYRKALRTKPNLVQAWNNLALVLDENSQLQEAEKYFRKAIQIKADYVNAYLNLGICLQKQEKHQESESILIEAIKLAPQDAALYHNLGHILQKQGRLEEAKLFYQKAITLNPHLAESYSDLSSLLSRLGDYSQAEKYAKQAVAINPNFIEAYNNLGNAQKGVHQYKQAEHTFKEGLIIAPDTSMLQNGLGETYLLQGQFDLAKHCFEQAIANHPFYPQAYSNLLFCLNFVTEKNSIYSATDYGQWLNTHLQPKTQSDHPRKDNRRIGFVSGDLREHSVSRFLIDVLPYLTQESSLEWFAYSNSAIEDSTSTELKKHFKEWHNISGLSDLSAANLIKSHEIDLLIDLSGHTALNRLPVFAYKPAPIQASWLGYFATTGVQQMDYIFVDRVGVPENNQSQFTEKLCYLPETRLCFSIPEDAPAVSSLPSEQNAFFTFGCFQHLSKVNDKVLTVWADIFDQVENAQLRWQCMQFADADLVAETQQRLARFGIGADRVRLLPSVNRQAYFSAHAEVDLILDTFPYPGGTTTCEALWMGVPTLTLAGDSLLASQGASLLHAAGLADFVANSEAEYVAKAVQLSQQQERLSSLRSQMRQQLAQSTLFDAKRFADDFLETVQSIFDSHQ